MHWGQYTTPKCLMQQLHMWAEPLFCAAKAPFNDPSIGEFHCLIQLEPSTINMSNPMSLPVHLCLPSCCFLAMCPQITRCFPYHLLWLMHHLDLSSAMLLKELFCDPHDWTGCLLETSILSYLPFLLKCFVCNFICI